MKTLLALTLLAAGIANAQTVIELPDPAVTVDLRSGNTALTIGGVTYRAASQFVYFSECAKRDGPWYHCDIVTESNVVLMAADGSVVVVNITAQLASTLIRSGHNWWRPSQVVLAGDVTVQ